MERRTLTLEFDTSDDGVVLHEDMRDLLFSSSYVT
jgi:hypothetical protein